MNSIYGAQNKNDFLEMHKLNSGRSKDNFSFVLIQENSFDLYKVHSAAKDFKFPKRKKYQTLLGINENKTKNFEPTVMNPSIEEEWVLSIKGDILNIEEIAEEFIGKGSKGFTQSNIIASMMKQTSEYAKNDVATITDCLSLIEGSYSLWVYNVVTGNVFVAKCNDNIYANIYENVFSTKPFDNSELLRDGELYLLTREGMTTVNVFDCSAF